ncbi:MAG: hypothetical protein KF690_09200 [Bacteroidetes bacterium]|nr:hypothetical protein [Bacteroidota bacterium]
MPEARAFRWLAAGGYLLLALVAFAVAYRMPWPDVEYNDFGAHFLFSLHWDWDFLTLNFLYYLLNYAASLLLADARQALVLVIGIFSLLYGFKALLLASEIRYQLPGVRPGKLGVLLAGLLFAEAIAVPAAWQALEAWEPGRFDIFMYRPNINVWHNATSMLLYPLSLLILHRSLRRWQAPRSGDTVLMGLVMLSVLVKPSFLLIYAPATGLMLLPLLLKQPWVQVVKRHRSLILSVVLGCLLLGVQYAGIYLGISPFDRVLYHGQPSGITLAVSEFLWPGGNPLWYSLVLLCSGFAFPLYVYIRYRRTLFQDPAMRWVGWMFGIGLFMALFIGETGPRAQHGNFIWQLHLANFLLFVYATLYYCRRQGFAFGWGWVLWGAHVASGLLYLSRLLLWGRHF